MNISLQRLWHAARQPVDAASIAVFRIALGFFVSVDAWRKGSLIFNTNEGKPFRFTYEGFEWIPSSGEWGDLIANCWLITGLCVMLGLLYRPMIILVTVLTLFGFLQGRRKLSKPLLPAHYRMFPDVPGSRQTGCIRSIVCCTAPEWDSR